MLSEYAVEPAAIGADWKTFLFLIEKFGVDKGRLISRLPNKWEKKVIQEAKASGVPDIRMASIVERLSRSRCTIPDDHIDPRRSALFMARSILREVRDGDATC